MPKVDNTHWEPPVRTCPPGAHTPTAGHSTNATGDYNDEPTIYGHQIEYPKCTNRCRPTILTSKIQDNNCYYLARGWEWQDEIEHWHFHCLLSRARPHCPTEEMPLLTIHDPCSKSVNNLCSLTLPNANARGVARMPMNTLVTLPKPKFCKLISPQDLLLNLFGHGGKLSERSTCPLKALQWSTGHRGHYNPRQYPITPYWPRRRPESATNHLTKHTTGYVRPNSAATNG